MTQEKNQKQNHEGQTSRSENKPSFWRTYFAKRWTYPVIYLGSAALIIGLMYAKSQDAFPFSKSHNETPNPTAQGGTALPTPAAPVNAPQWVWPVGEDGQDVNVTMNFFDDSKDKAAQAASLLKFNDTFYTQNGIVMGLKNDKTFTVVAAASGKVTRVEDNPLLGKAVEITHDNGYVTYYASLSTVDVKEGDAILQGQPLGKSGNNKLEASQKNHLHFEVKKDGKNVDPISVLPMRGDAAQTQAAPQNPADAKDQPAASTPGGAGSQDKQGAKEPSSSDTSSDSPQPSDPAQSSSGSQPSDTTKQPDSTQQPSQKSSSTSTQP
jgi:stage II sporulation protein Q